MEKPVAHLVPSMRPSDPHRSGATTMADTKANTRNTGFTKEEKAAMQERARELKAAKEGADGEADLLAKVAEMPKADRDIAQRIHAIVKATAPDLVSRPITACRPMPRTARSCSS